MAQAVVLFLWYFLKRLNLGVNKASLRSSGVMPQRPGEPMAETSCNGLIGEKIKRNSTKIEEKLYTRLSIL